MLREGSVWRKWDLHVHAPSSVMNNQFPGETIDDKWDQYFAAVEQLGEYGCLGITDYFSIDGYKRVRARKQAGGLRGVSLILPNVEMRIVPVTDRSKPINLHLLVSPMIADELDDLLFSRLRFRYQGGTFACTRGGLVGLGRAFSNNVGLDEIAAYKVGVEQFKLEVSDLRDCLNENRRLLQQTLVVVANSNVDGNSGIQDSGLRAVREEIYALSNCVFSGNPKDRAYFLGEGAESRDEIARRYGSRKPCIHGCDAHDLAKLGVPDKGRHTWIKADPTFEGLRQICDEPGGRVHIGEYPPETPVHRITAARLSYPDDAAMRWKEKGDELPFCFRGRTELAFAAGLTCVIGGRGAGKSTLLNIMHERLAPGQNEYLRERSTRAGDKVITAQEYVEVEFQGDQAGLEFISQNQVEQVATSPEELTKAILTRLLAQDAGALASGLAESRAARATLERRSALVRDEARIVGEIADVEAAVGTSTALIESFTDPAYQASSAALQAASVRLAALASDRRALAALVSATEQALQTAPAGSGPNAYHTAAERFRTAVRAAITEVRAALDLASPNADELAGQAEASRHKHEVEAFLQTRGLSPENLADVASASQRVAELRSRSAQLADELARVREELKSLAVDLAVRARFESAVTDALARINAVLANVHRDVKKIELRYVFDEDAAECAAVDDLCKALTELAGPGRRVQTHHVKAELDTVPPLLEADVGVLVDAVRQHSGKTAELLDAYFGIGVNRALWDITRARHRLDLDRFMRLGILYDGKPLARSSFGQRCSAVLIVLLMLGNTPIVIDEPEAHLDSAIIANYLVELVKEVKKRRQIVFATHNANFVVNGDAELIHVVAMDGENRSTVRSITIEDVEARPLLLALEGGEAAFVQREGRYRLDARGA